MPGKMARSDPRPSVRVTRGAGSGQHLASVLQEGRENANSDAGLGFIWRTSASDVVAGRLRAFHPGLKEAGYVEGENVAIRYRFAENQMARLPELAADLVRQQVAVISATAGGPLPHSRPRRPPPRIPILFILAQDSVGLGLVSSY
jgi:putative tryptophan/tyrosine transport system substrate-binding protein